MIIYSGQAVKINFNIGIDTTLTTDIKLNYRKPDGVEGGFGTIIVSDGPSGEVYYVATDGQIDTIGTWVFWSDVTTGTGQFYGHPFTVEVKEEGDNITNKDFVKAYLGITSDIYDVQICYLIPLIESDYLIIRNAPFDTDAEGNTVYPPGSGVTASEMIASKLKPVTEFVPGDYGKDVTSESLDAHSISFATGTGAGGNMKYGYPKSAISSIEKFNWGL